MSWRDFFYFSKGERSGLIVLLCLIVIAGILLILNNRPATVNDSGLNQTSTANSRESSDKNSDAKQLNTQSSTNKPSSAKELQADKSSTAANSTKQNATSQTTDDNGHIEEEGDITSTDTGKPKKESVSERVQRLTSYSHPSYTRTEKFKEGTIVELNTADTTILKKVPGIGSAFAKRIVSYRNLLGGYYSVTQLSEVYGVDEDRYNAFVPWFSADPSLISTLAVNSLPQDSLRRHPYINYGQAKVIAQLRKQKGRLTGWENLQLLNEFTDNDKIKLQHYLSFE